MKTLTPALLSCVLINSSLGGVIFESDFSADTGYTINSINLFETSNVPTGWDAVKASENSSIEVKSGEGLNGKNALKLTWDPNSSQPTIRLMKHLTGNKNTGYDELYIRYHVRFPDSFKAGDGTSSVPYWKWGRLWQNTSPTLDATWTENREDSFYVVWNFAGSPTYGIDTNVVVSANTGSNLAFGSAGGERYNIDYYNGITDFTKASGFFQSIGNGAWEIDWINNKGHFITYGTSQSQTWHTIEYHIKLATNATSNDGVWEMWFDGVKQGDWVRIIENGGAPKLTGIPTTKHGSGFNFFVFFDNMYAWNKDWGQSGVDGFIYVNDVVVSDSYIGPDYRVGANIGPATITLPPPKVNK
ncbi:hypothetical protein NO559_15120 [Dasania sp. GY-MA-18]|uniref:Uncharacterized protein n=1 Tax=Dasania phycosphaerae TaxID=2950436 RepID=A0A9J6RRA7_9GAMM|nr:MULTISPECIES: hypothetical protein [Dasania]MCR8924114.1 hypothetical protein [Dasania sp. GY-MA-18]MCZ0866687.1 hypothetical protein [Dasania phycosphaerae]MCZ0870272.1 hypothetical protein [Dasania phycosphaerae]